MRVIEKRTLQAFYEQPLCKESEQPLKAWYSEAIKTEHDYDLALAEVLNDKRPLSLDMIRKLWLGLHIPLESLIDKNNSSIYIWLGA